MVLTKAGLCCRSFTAFISESDFAEGILELGDPNIGNCDVIVDDITYITEPFYRKGLVEQAIETVVGYGVDYFVSAGNFGSNGFEAAFSPVEVVDSEGQTRYFHNFGGGDYQQQIDLKSGVYTIVLQWDDDFYSDEAGPAPTS